MKQERASVWRDGLICLLLALGTMAVYWPVRDFEFLNFDDPAYVTGNPQVFRGITTEGMAWAFSSFHASNWHPMTWLSHMLDCQLFGPEPGWHHLVNVLFHMANTILLFGLLRYLTGAVFRSALVAVLFALHPLHVESVAWIAERKDVLSTFFGLLALWAYARYARSKDGKPKAGTAGQKPALSFQFSVFDDAKGVRYAIALILFALGLMSKPMLVTLPFLLLLLDFWPLGRFQLSNLRFLLLEKLPFFMLSAAASVVTMLAQKAGGAVMAATVLPIGSRLINAAMAYAGYLRKMIWPTDLAAFYPYRHNLPAGEIVGSLLILTIISALAFRLARRTPYLLFGWLWYLGMLVPVIGLVQVGGQCMADRYTYVPLVGVFVMCVWGAADLLAGFRYQRLVAGVLSAGVLVGCIYATRFHAKYWHDSETLFLRDLQLYPQANGMAHHCLGRALFLKGDDAGAMTHYREVLRLLPNLAAGHLNLANCLSRQEKFEEARLHFDEAIRLRPDDAETFKSLGSSLAAQLRLEEARTNFVQALQYKPDYADAHLRLGTLLMAQGKVDDAMRHLTSAVEIYPDFDEARYYLANALVDQKRFAEAATHFRAAIKANPTNAAALNDLAWMLVTSDPKRANLTEVIGLATRACELTQHKNASYLETLGIALAEAGRFPEAIAATEQAILAAAATGQQSMVAEMEKRLAIYRTGRSYFNRVVTSPNR